MSQWCDQGRHVWLRVGQTSSKWMLTLSAKCCIAWLWSSMSLRIKRISDIYSKALRVHEVLGVPPVKEFRSSLACSYKKLRSVLDATTDICWLLALYLETTNIAVSLKGLGFLCYHQILERITAIFNWVMLNILTHDTLSEQIVRMKSEFNFKTSSCAYWHFMHLSHLCLFAPWIWWSLMRLKWGGGQPNFKHDKGFHLPNVDKTHDL